MGGSLNQYFNYLKLKHEHSNRFDTYSCSQGQCCRTFSSKYTFIGHSRVYHSDDFVDRQHNSSGNVQTSLSKAAVLNVVKWKPIVTLLIMTSVNFPWILKILPREKQIWQNLALVSLLRQKAA